MFNEILGCYNFGSYRMFKTESGNCLMVFYQSLSPMIMPPQRCFGHCIIRIGSKASECDFVWFGRRVPAFQRNLPPLLSVWKSG
jgi:hypothetical protein